MCKHILLGFAELHEQCIRVLNRVVTWTIGGIFYAVDQGPGEIIIQQFKFIDVKPVFPPGTREKQVKVVEDLFKLMNKNDASSYRTIIARFDYLSMDRFDIQLATKEAATYMSPPKGHFFEKNWQIFGTGAQVSADLQLAQREQQCMRVQRF